MAPPRMPIPSQFYDLAAAGEVAEVIARKLGVCGKTVRHWSKRTGTSLATAHPDKWEGVGYQELVRINGGLPLTHSDSLYYRYRTQQKRAKQRGIAWEITFAEWVTVWTDSGKLAERGTNSNAYVMGRNGDVGPYSVSNVSIIPLKQNVKDGVARYWLRRQQQAAV
jgi:hypothetical protein